MQGMPLPDTVRVRLLASFRVEHLELVAPAGWATPEFRHTRSIMLHASDAGITVGNRRVPTLALAAQPPGAIQLRMNGKRRTFNGRLVITATSGELVVIGHCGVRNYLASALAAEAAPNDPLEYLTALAVLQRNYLLFHRGRHGTAVDLCDNTHCQRADPTGANARTYEAVDRASGIELSAGDGLPCYYSVCCGGGTLTPAQAWNHAEPGYSNVRCGYCRNSSRYRWQRSFAATPTAEAIVRTAPRPPFVDDDFKIRLGRVVGFNVLLSNSIDRLERHGREYVIAGRGFGHRIGMCQEGARTMATRGRTARQILHYYFPDAVVSLRPAER